LANVLAKWHFERHGLVKGNVAADPADVEAATATSQFRMMHVLDRAPFKSV